MPRHLQRLIHVWPKQPLFFVTTCVAGREALLANATAHGILRDEWQGLAARHGWLIGRYVVMPDHVHFFTTPQPETSRSLSWMVGAWKEWSAKGLLAHVRKSGSLWQEEFFDHVLRSKASYAEKWDYVRNNPVRARLVERAEDWPYAGSIHFE